LLVADKVGGSISILGIVPILEILYICDLNTVLSDIINVL
jgi:hypothetical protein